MFPHQNFFPFHALDGGTFQQTYRATPMIAYKPELEYGGQIILPPSALGRLSQLNLVGNSALLFRISKSGGFTSSHCGVYEFTAEEGRVYMPLWMMANLGVEPNDFVNVTSVVLPRGTFAKFKPMSKDFYQISDPRAVLENTLRKYSTLTIGEILEFSYNDNVYRLEVLELKPATAVSIIETDLQVDFAPADDYVEPSAATTAKTEHQEEKIDLDELDEIEATIIRLTENGEEGAEKPKSPAFSGAGYRISGKPVNSPKGGSVATKLAKDNNSK